MVKRRSSHRRRSSSRRRPSYRRRPTYRRKRSASVSFGLGLGLSGNACTSRKSALTCGADPSCNWTARGCVARYGVKQGVLYAGPLLPQTYAPVVDASWDKVLEHEKDCKQRATETQCQEAGSKCRWSKWTDKNNVAHGSCVRQITGGAKRKRSTKRKRSSKKKHSSKRKRSTKRKRSVKHHGRH